MPRRAPNTAATTLGGPRRRAWRNRPVLVVAGAFIAMLDRYDGLLSTVDRAADSCPPIGAVADRLGGPPVLVIAGVGSR